MSRRLRPAPPALRVRSRERRIRVYARFYGNYVNLIGRRKRFSFSVKVSPRITNKMVGKYIRRVCSNLRDNRVPEHVQGEVFPTFRELLLETRWLKTRRGLKYEAGVVYER